MSELQIKVARHLAGAERPSDVRDSLFEAYMSEPDGREMPKRSSVVTSEVFDAVEAVSAELMDMVAMDQRVASFMAESADDEQQAKDETDALNKVFWEDQDGFELLQVFCKAGLIEQVGYVQSGWVKVEKTVIEEFSALDFGDAASVLAKYEGDDAIDDLEVLDLEGAEYDDELGFLPQIDDDMAIEPISFKIKCVKMVDEYDITPLPQSKVSMTPRWHKQDVQDIPFFAIEHDEYSAIDLVAMGFTEASVERIGKEDDESDENRHNTKDNQDHGAEVDDDTTALTVYECYILDEGARKRVWTDGKAILDKDTGPAVEEVDSVPISSWTPIKVPHRHVGRGVSEITKDLQQINTALWRSSLDSMYATMFPRPEVNTMQATSQTFADLAVTAPGAPIRSSGAAITWQKPPNILGDTLPMMERVASAKEERTGVSRLNQGLDATTLNKTASGQAMLLTQGQKRLKLIARNFAEGVREIMLRMHRDYRKGNGGVVTYQRNGKWVEQNPIEWPERRKMSVSVGTGNGDRAEKQQTLMMAGNLQRELMQSGSLMVTEAHVFETANRMMQMGGFPSADPFMLNPSSPEYQKRVKQAQATPKELSPEMVLAQAEAKKAEAQGAEAQADAQLALARIKLDAQKAAQAHEVKMAELRLRERGVSLDEVKVAADIQDANEKQDLAEEQFQQNAAMDQARLAVDVAKQ